MYLLSNIYSIPVSGILNWVYLFFGTFLVLINQLGFSVPPLELFTVYAISVVMTAFVALSLYKEISTTKRDRRWLLSLLLLSLKTLKEKLKRMPWPFKLIPLLGLIGAVYPDNLPNVADFSKSLPIIGDFNPYNNPNPGRGWFPWGEPVAGTPTLMAGLGEPVAGTPTVDLKTPWASTFRDTGRFLAKLGSNVYGGVTQLLGSDYSDLKEGVLKPCGNLVSKPLIGIPTLMGILHLGNVDLNYLLAAMVGLKKLVGAVVSLGLTSFNGGLEAINQLLGGLNLYIKSPQLPTPRQNPIGFWRG